MSFTSIKKASPCDSLLSNWLMKADQCEFPVSHFPGDLPVQFGNMQAWCGSLRGGCPHHLSPVDMSHVCQGLRSALS